MLQLRSLAGAQVCYLPPVGKTALHIAAGPLDAGPARSVGLEIPRALCSRDSTRMTVAALPRDSEPSGAIISLFFAKWKQKSPIEM